eukprot:546745-Pyramimonas_sp.AAC.1
MLSDDGMRQVGEGDLVQTAWDQDTAAADYARQHAIRDLARQELFRSSSRRKLAEASQSNVHRGVKVYPGQWVFVWRRAPTSGKKTYALQRDRWVGPGLVLLQSGGT